MNWQEVQQTAREKLRGVCRVCPVCNGIACAGKIPGMGGIGTGLAFQHNIQALAVHKFNLRTVHNIIEPRLDCTILGLPLALPVIGAAIGGTALNLNAALTEEEYATAVVGGCHAAGTVCMTGDGPNPAIFTAGLSGLKTKPGGAIPVIKPRDNATVVAMANDAAAAGALAFGMDIDAAALINMTNAGMPIGPKTVADLTYIKQHTGIPFIVKGIMTVDEAVACCKAGVDAIVVSNHGGRALDHTPGTAEVLPYIADAVQGKLTVLVDGGIRSGADILKMLALGANAVLIGRPVAIAAVGGGTAGVEMLMSKLARELRAAMVLTGTAQVTQVSCEILW